MSDNQQRAAEVAADVIYGVVDLGAGLTDEERHDVLAGGTEAIAAALDAAEERGAERGRAEVAGRVTVLAGRWQAETGWGEGQARADTLRAIVRCGTGMPREPA